MMDGVEWSGVEWSGVENDAETCGAETMFVASENPRGTRKSCFGRMQLIPIAKRATIHSQGMRVPFTWPSGAEDALEVRNDGRSALRQVLTQCEMRAVDCTEELMPRLVGVVGAAMRRKGWSDAGPSDVAVPLVKLTLS